MKKLILSSVVLFLFACKKEQPVNANQECGKIIAIEPTVLNGHQAINITIELSNGHQAIYGTPFQKKYYIGMEYCIPK
jgi:hypothetical protein